MTRGPKQPPSSAGPAYPVGFSPKGVPWSPLASLSKSISSSAYKAPGRKLDTLIRLLVGRPQHLHRQAQRAL